MIFLRHELFWFCLVQVSTTQFCSFPAFLMAPVSDGTNVPISPAPASSSKFGSLMALAPTSMVWAPALEVQRMLSFRNLYTSKNRSRKFLHFSNWMSRMGSHFTKTPRDFATRLTEMEQNFSTLTARMCKVETYAASASNVSGSARSWPALEQVDGSTAAGSHGQDHLMTPETLDADLIFPQTLTMSMRKVPSCCGSHANNTTKGLRLGSIIFGKIPTCQLPINLSQFIARQALCQPGLYLKQEPKARFCSPISR